MQGIWKKAPAFICLFGVVGIASLLVNLDPNLVRAQEAKENLPHLGDLMNNAMQIHHTKLWFAGHANNWALASYELRKIKETIEQVKEDIVTIQNEVTSMATRVHQRDAQKCRFQSEISG